MVFMLLNKATIYLCPILARVFGLMRHLAELVCLCMNRIARYEAATDDLRALEFSDDFHEQERLIAKLMRYDVEYGLNETQKAVFNVLRGEHMKQAGDAMPQPQWLQNRFPPFPLNDGEV